MKNFIIKPIFLALVAMISIQGCEKESNLEPEGQWIIDAAVNDAPQSGATIVLNETNPLTTIDFAWNAAESTAPYGIFYSVIIDSLDAKNANAPIIEINSDNSGKDLTASISHEAIDEALSLAGFDASSTIELNWSVKAVSLSKSSISSESSVSITRFNKEIIPAQIFISGEATETGTDLSAAIQLKRLNGADKTPSNKHEIYTKLLAQKPFMFYSAQSLPAHKYGGDGGSIIKNGDELSVEEEGVYRISIDLDANTYTLFKINQLGAIGDAFETGWGGDQFLEYMGMGVWQASLNFVKKSNFIFRANGNWENILKRVVGTENEIVAESDASSQGVSFEDIPGELTGQNILTLDLSANGYFYTIMKDPNAPDLPDPIAAPEKLFLFENGNMIYEFVKDGDKFNSEIFLSLQTGNDYTLNAASDGSGRAFTIGSNLGADGSGNSAVSANLIIAEEATPFNVEYDQAFKLEMDFSVSGLKWTYYKIYLFHWDELGQKWDERNEFEMNYIHPHQYTVDADLKANYDMKFISPWDIDMGSDNAAALTGALINKGGSNIRNITNDGSYTVSITVDNKFETGTYKFE